MTPETQEQKILRMLEAGPKNTGELCAEPGLSAEYRRAISTLRKKGHVITARREREGSWVYELVKTVKADLWE